MQMVVHLCIWRMSDIPHTCLAIAFKLRGPPKLPKRAKSIALHALALAMPPASCAIQRSVHGMVPKQKIKEGKRQGKRPNIVKLYETT